MAPANPFHALLSPYATPEQHCQWLHGLLPLDDYRAAPDGWAAQGLAKRLPDLLLGASICSGISLRWADLDEVPVLLVYGGALTVRQAEGCWCLGPGDLLVLNGAKAELRSGAGRDGTDAVLLLCQRRRLVGVALELAGSARPRRAWIERLAHSACFRAGLDGCRDGLLLQAIRLELESLALLLTQGPVLLPFLQPQQRLFRLLALLLFPELALRPSVGSPSASAAASQRSSADPAPAAGVPLEALLLQIQSHLDQPLSLEWLERQSHYSRRALQYAFRRRFQLSPMAWIRQQRLARAHHRLSQPQPGDSVASIARSCGYRHLSSFSKEFQRAFQRRPSELLRASRGVEELTPQEEGGARCLQAPG